MRELSLTEQAGVTGAARRKAVRWAPPRTLRAARPAAQAAAAAPFCVVLDLPIQTVPDSGGTGFTPVEIPFVSSF